jgi:SHS2 domain-containing protein
MNVMPPAETVPGVVPLEHVADIGIKVRAASLVQLFDRAAAGMMALLRAGAAPAGGTPAEHEIVGNAGDSAALLVLWLRELLYLRQVYDFDYHTADFIVLEEQRLHARVRGVADPRPPSREIKGVTYHALAVALKEGEWHAQVIFDV